MMYPFLTLDDQTEIVHSENKATVPYNFMLKSLMHEVAFILRTFCSQPAYGPTSPVFRKKSFGHTRM